MSENAALQGRTVQVDTVHVFWGGFVVEYRQIAGNCKEGKGDSDRGVNVWRIGGGDQGERKRTPVRN